MAYKKGESGNPNGRPKGAKNQTTTTVRAFIMDLINSDVARQQIQRDFLALDAWQRLTMVEKLLPYVLPKVERAEEVEGAAYTREDINKTGGYLGIDTEIVPWYEKELEQAGE